MITRRSMFGILAAALGATPVAAMAQIGAMPSSTAPSNSEGTPSGGTGVIGRSQVDTGMRATPVSARRHRRDRRHHRSYR